MRTTSITVPSGDVYIIREQTGADDDIVSNMSNGEADAINLFIAGIISAGPDGKRLTKGDVEDMLLRDKYSILIHSRIFSLSDSLSFDYDWGDGDIHSYTEDIARFVWDYSKPAPEKGDANYSPVRFKKYPNNVKDFVLTLKSGKEIRFKFLDGKGELYLLKLKENERTINKQLIARGFSVKKDDKFVVVKNFSFFNAREMAEIRGYMDEQDAPPVADVVIENPFNGESINLPLIALKDFFFPVKF